MSDRFQAAKAVMQSARLVKTEAEVAAAYDQLAADIAADYRDNNPIILCVMMGGMVPTAEIIRRLDFPFELDYLHATRYRGETSGGELMWKASPALDLADRHVLVIDDILDEGYTFQAIINALSAQGVASLKTAVLLDKQHDRRVDNLTADYVGLQIEDSYVFGCGMDYRNYFRQLSAIYALDE